MTPRPPEGSTISITAAGSETVIVIPYPKAGFGSYGIGLFILFWLGGWGYGLHAVVSQIVSGQGNLFLLFWLGGWTVGGAFAAYTAFRIIRGPEPEILGLTRTSVRYDSGIPPFEMKQYSGRSNRDWSSYFPKRTRMELDRRELQSLQLRQTDLGNRLTIDNGATRLDLAKQATEIEREWLYKVLAERYLAGPPKDTAAAVGQPAG
jgi:hypothetical protein